LNGNFSHRKNVHASNYFEISRLLYVDYHREIRFLPRTSDPWVVQQRLCSRVQLYTAVIQESEQCVVLFCPEKKRIILNYGSVTWSKLSARTYAHKLANSTSVGYSTFFGATVPSHNNLAATFITTWQRLRAQTGERLLVCYNRTFSNLDPLQDIKNDFL
jgi:hypothetical protein